MRKIFTLLFILLVVFSGCEKNKFEDKSAKDIVSNTEWKEVDKTQDRYVLYKFEGDSYREEHYASQLFNDLIEVKNGKIISSDTENMVISINGDGVYNCYTYVSTNKDSMSFSCKPQNGVGEENCLTLWRYK